MPQMKKEEVLQMSKEIDIIRELASQPDIKYNTFRQEQLKKAMSKFHDTAPTINLKYIVPAEILSLLDSHNDNHPQDSTIPTVDHSNATSIPLAGKTDSCDFQFLDCNHD